MAYFGSDGLEHQNRQLKAQLSSKDAEITSIRNELRKKDEDMTEIKRSRETASYKLEEEADRAHKAEAALQQKSTELANLRMQHDNLQSSLRNANDKLKAGEKENKGLQYDNDSLGSSTAQVKILQEERDKLATKVKDLEGKLRRVEEEKENVRHSGPGGMKRSNTDFFGAALSPINGNKRSNRRRSTSLSSDNRVSELEAELEVLRAATGPGQVEVEKLKAQLTNVKRELDKTTNAKLAVERSSKREIDEVKSQLEDVNFELEDWRRNDGSGGKAALEKVKKDAAATIDALVSKVAELEREVDRRTADVGRLQAQLEAELEAEKAKTSPSSGSSPATSAQVDELEEKIIVLESELRQARASGSSGTSNDKSARVLQREIKSLQRIIDEQKEELAAQDEEVTRLSSAIPLPESPGLKPVSVKVDMDKILDLENRLEQAELKVAATLKDKDRVQAQVDDHKLQLTSVMADREKAQIELDKAQAALIESTSRIVALETDLSFLRSSANKHTEGLELAKRLAQDANDTVEDLRSKLDEVNKRYLEATEQLTSRSHSDEEVTAIRQALLAKEEIAARLKTDVEASHSELNDVRSAVAVATAERDAALATNDSRQEEVSSLMDRLVAAEDRIKDTAAEKKNAVKAVKDKYRVEIDGLKLRLVDAQKSLEDAEARVEVEQERFQEAFNAKLELEASLAEAREEIANRSTESDARLRDEELFDQKEILAELRKTLEDERAEHVKEKEMATFILTQDLDEARSKLVGLEKDVQALEIGKKHLRLAEDKIMRLRAERDDLRNSLSFVNHEQRFTSQEATKHRQALDVARVLLEKQSASLATLESEQVIAGHTSSKLESDLAEATTSRDALMGQVQEIEAKLKASMEEHAVQAEQSGDLVSILALAQSKASRAEGELAQLRKACKELEERHDRAQALLEAKREVGILEESNGANRSASPISEERPGSAFGHRSKRSGISTSMMDMIEGLKVDKADLAGRLSRRDARISGLLVEIKQVQANLRLAEDSAIENCEEKETTSRELVQLQEAFEEKTSELLQSDRNLGMIRSELGAHRQMADDLRQQLVSTEKSLFETQSDTRVHERSMQEVIVALAAAYKVAKREQQVAKAGVIALRQADMTIERVEGAVNTAFSDAKDRIVGLSTEVARLEQELVAARDRLSSTTTSETTLRQQLDTAELALTEMSDKLAQAETTRVELQISQSRVTQLEGDLQTANGTLRDRQGDVETLLQKLATAEKARGAIEADTSAYEAVCAQLESVKVDKAGLVSERDALIDNLAGLEASIGDIDALNKETTARLASEHQTEMGRQVAENGDLQLRLVSASREQSELEAKLIEVERQVYDKVDDIARLEGRLSADKAIIDQLQAGTTELEVQQAMVGDLSNDLRAERATVSELKATMAELERSSVSLASERDDLLSRISSLEGDIQVARVDRARLAESDSAIEANKAVIQQLEVQIAELETSAAEAVEKNTDRSRQLQQLDAELSSTQQHVTSLREAEATFMEKMAQMSMELATTTAALGTAQLDATTAQDDFRRVEMELSALRHENELLSTDLANANTAKKEVSGDSAALQDLQERIAELEASLTLKVQEVDDADDKVREVYKEKSKLEKKVAKLQRQLATANTTPETVANTAANRSIPVTADMAPPPSSARSLGVAFTPQSAIAASPRQPLRPVNVFDPKPSPGGLKRAREEKIDEKPLPAECILLSPAQLTKTTPRSFRPMKKDTRVYDVTASQPPQPRINIFVANDNVRSV